MLSPFQYVQIIPYLIGTGVLLIPMSSFLTKFTAEEYTLNDVLALAGDLALPAGTMNTRTSAHFLEINSIYGAEMTRRFEKKAEQIRAERSSQSDVVKATKYASKTYKYEPRPPAHYLQ